MGDRNLLAGMTDITLITYAYLKQYIYYHIARIYYTYDRGGSAAAKASPPFKKSTQVQGRMLGM